MRTYARHCICRWPFLFSLAGVLLAHAPVSAQQLIFIDAGHGGRDPGAVGCGQEEATNVLDVSQRLKALVENAGLRTQLARSDDTFVTLSGRTSTANAIDADRFVSIHINAAESVATGTETFMANTGSAASRDMRDRIQTEMIAEWMLRDRGGKMANFHVLTASSMPASLSELGFINNCAVDALLVADPDRRQGAAEAHFRALMAHLDLPATGGTGRVLGVVFEDVGVGAEDTTRRLVGANVRLSDQAITSGADGMFTFTAPVGNQLIEADLAGFRSSSRECVVASGDTWCSIGLVRSSGTPPDAGVSEDAAVFVDAGPPDSVGEDSGGPVGPRVPLDAGCGCTSNETRGDWFLAIPLALFLLLRRRGHLGKRS